MKLPLILTIALAATVSADTLRSAKLTQVVEDVKVYKGKSEGRAASLGEKIDGSTSVTTGRRSRAELTFQDNTITRLGQNSVFSFRNGSRDVELKQGSVLLQVPKNAGGATIRTATVTAAITGTTSMFEYNPGKWVKLLTLEGTQKIYVKGSDKPVSVPAGQMVIMHPDGRVVPSPVIIDVAKLLKTSALADKKTFGDLPEGASNAIDETVENQKDGKRSGRLLPTKRVIKGPGFERARKGEEARVTPYDRHYRFRSR